MKNKYEKYGVGKVFPTNNYGNIEIVEKLKDNFRNVFFLDYNEFAICGISSIRTGTIKPKSIKSLCEVGGIFENSKFLKFEIIEKYKNELRRIKFLISGYETTVVLSNIIRGSVDDRFSPSICNIGFLGENTGDYQKQIYSLWSNMIKRCYNEKLSLKFPTYKNVTVCKEWHNYSNFVKWHKENYPNNVEGIKFDMDKDLRQIGMENKVYSPETCIFLPQKINKFLCSLDRYKNNSEHVLGASFNKRYGKWGTKIKDFDTQISFCKYSNSIEEASEIYAKYRAENSEKVKNYLRSLNYLSEEIIELVK